MWNHVHGLLGAGSSKCPGRESEFVEAMAGDSAISEMQTQENKQHHTPLELAARLGEKKMLERIIGWPNYGKHPYAGCQLLWRFGSIECCLVPLKLIDPPFDPTKCDDGLLFTIDKYGRWELLEDGNIAWELLQAKWLAYGRDDFWWRLVSYSVLLTIFSWTTLNDSPDLHVFQECTHHWRHHWNANAVPNACPTSAWATLWTIFMGGFAVWKLFCELCEIHVHGTQVYFLGGHGARTIENYSSLIGCTSFLLSHLLELFWFNAPSESDAAVEGHAPFLSRVLGVVAAFMAWGYVFFFLLGFQSSGTLVVMLSEMLSRDVTRFLSVYAIMLAAFTHGLMVLADSDHRSRNTVKQSARYWVQMMLGADSDDLDEAMKTDFTGQEALFQTLLISYLVAINVLTLNTLIAMMSKTYERVEESNKLRWRLEKLRILLSMESEYDYAQNADSKRRSYFTVGENDERFLMVHQESKKAKKSKTEDEEDDGDDDDTSEGKDDEPLAVAEDGPWWFGGAYSLPLLGAWIVFLASIVLYYSQSGIKTKKEPLAIETSTCQEEQQMAAVTSSADMEALKAGMVALQAAMQELLKRPPSADMPAA